MDIVFIATDTQRNLLSGLLDLNQTDLLKDFAWVEFRSGETLPDKALRTRRGELGTERVQQVFNRATEHLLLVDIRVVGPAHTVISADQEISFINTYKPPQQTEMTKLRTVFYTSEQAGTEDFTQRAGWVSLVVSPEDTDRPNAHPEPWWNLDADTEPLMLAALVSLARLWKGAPNSLDERLSATGDLRIAKTYVRGTNAHMMQKQVSDAVFQLPESYMPLETESQAEVKLVPDSNLAAEQMANQWWGLAQQDAILLQDEPTPPDYSRFNIGFGAALKQFFTFLWHQLSNAPSRITRDMVNRAAQRTAKAVEHMVYGADAEHRVIVGGRDAEGRPASWQDIQQSAILLSEKSDREAGFDMTQDVHVSYSSIVQRFINGGLTLADGRSSGSMKPANEGGRPAIVDHVDRIAPDSMEWSVNYTGVDLAVTDLPQIQSAIDSLLSTDDSGTATDALRGLTEWKDKIDSSYVGKIVGRVSDAFASQRQRTQDAVKELRETDAELKALQTAGNGRNTGVKRGFIANVVTVVLLAAIGTYWYFTDYPWWAMTIAMTLILIVWLVVQLFAARFYFHEQEQARWSQWVANEKIPYLLQVITVSTRNTQRISGLALTLEYWAPVLAEFIRRPFGRAGQDTDDSVYPTNLAGSVQLLTTEVDANEQESYVVANRGAWHMQGWATNMWEEFMADVPNVLQSERQRQYFLKRRDAMYEQRHNDEALQELFQVVLDNGVGTNIRAATERRIGMKPIQQYVTVDGQRISREAFLDGALEISRSSVVQKILTADAVGRNLNIATADNTSDFEMRSGEVWVSEAIFLTPRITQDNLSLDFESPIQEVPQPDEIRKRGRGLQF
ncbi:MAG: hypothetical protein ACTHWM_05340 [Yaniella sp.]|uniref:hypothetical protein n=1 Tax=Yaniella sp. TaxID=2773929 RepID=UPI003F9B781B